MNPHNAQLPPWMFRLVSRRRTAQPSSQLHTRTQVCPPELWPSSITWQGRFKRWAERLRNSGLPWQAEQNRPVNRLAQVKSEFQDSLSDRHDSGAQALLDQIGRARSLRELWHLRSPVYGAVALARTQAEAEQRLARLNRHFPVRAPRTSALALDA